MPKEEDLTEQTRIALMVYAVVRLHRAHMNNRQRRTAMTDDSVIEEAAKAMFATRYPESRPDLAEAAWGTISNMPEGIDLRDESRAAFAVFEKAHAPTDDEREALAKAMCTVETRSKAASLEEVQAGIQRWTRHRYEAERLIEELADAGFALRRAEVTEPQGEPSDAQVLTAYRAHIEARMGRALHDAEFEATKSRIEIEWLRSALRAVGVTGSIERWASTC